MRMRPVDNIAGAISRRLAAQAEAVCRHYLSAGRREGRYWMVGDVRNTPGRSLYVRLSTSPDGGGAAGKWTDYVAPLIMLRSFDRAGFRRVSSAWTQHNLSAWGVA
jgi:hypothetical protein